MPGCERMQERAVAALTQGQNYPADVAAHLQSCSECASEIGELQQLWIDLKHSSVPAGSAEAMERIANTIRLASQIKPEKESVIMKVTWLVAAALAGALLGGVGARALVERPEPEVAAETAAQPVVPAGPMYLLLLHETSAQSAGVSAAQMDSIVAEYTAWAGKLHTEQRLVSAEKLADDSGRWLSPSGPVLVDRSEHVSGFFLIRAANYEEAVTIAQASPHIKYGGTIEVRAIESTPDPR